MYYHPKWPVQKPAVIQRQNTIKARKKAARLEKIKKALILIAFTGLYIVASWADTGV